MLWVRLSAVKTSHGRDSNDERPLKTATSLSLSYGENMTIFPSRTLLF